MAPMSGRERTCLSSLLACASCNQTVQQIWVTVLLGTCMTNGLRPSVRHFDHVVEELRLHHRSRAMTLHSSSAGWSVVIMLVPTSFKTDSVRCQLNKFSNHASAVDSGSTFGNLFMTLSTTEFQRQAPSTSWKFSSDLRLLVNFAEIILCSYGFLSLHPITYHRLWPTRISSGFQLSCSSLSGVWKTIGPPMHGLSRIRLTLGAIGRVMAV